MFSGKNFGIKEMAIYCVIILFVLLFASLSFESLNDRLTTRMTVNQQQYQEQVANNHKGEPKNPSHEDESDKLPPIVNPDNNSTDESFDDLDSNNDASEYDQQFYTDLENEIKSGALSYINKYNYDLSEGKVRVSLNTLIDFGFVKETYDTNGELMCEGYADISLDSNGNYVAKPFIKCKGYTTSGY